MSKPPFFLFFPLLSLTTLTHATSLSTDNTIVTVILTENSTIRSQNNTFELGFFTLDSGSSNFYLGIWYTSIPTRTYVWVANRDTPLKNLSSFSLILTSSGKLAIVSVNGSSIWETTNTEKATEFRLLESGNLVLKSVSGVLLWQSFDYPTDTWLPGMNFTTYRNLTSWRSLKDPSPGFYSLRLNPREFNEFELVSNRKGFVYWSTGNWTGNAFAGVPEMTIPYIYRFYFVDAFSPMASFRYEERSLEGGTRPPLTRFQVDVNGQVKQFTWSQQIENWYMFWSQPENQCRVYGLCGDFGVCKKGNLNPCDCLSGFRLSGDWESSDFSGGCVRNSEVTCAQSDGFNEVGVVGFEGAVPVSFVGSRGVCERSCLGNCSCVGLAHDDKRGWCKNFYGGMLNLRNLSSDSTNRDVLFLRVPKGGVVKKSALTVVVWICSAVVLVAIFVLGAMAWMVVQRRRMKSKGLEEDRSFPMLSLKVFSYKELNAATRGFSDKIGHGGFGAVFQGQLIDSTLVAVKRLERPGSGEKEFRAEVRTIGNIQHVNLVRLRGFCSENSHRLLVYDYMPNGPLSMYLRQGGPNLSWDARFRVAVGTARGIAYLHEECRECIIHCDIKPENILLDSGYTAKISDFGLAKLIGRDFSRVLATMRGTWGYVAPEWISGVAITTKADVYSYGMTLLELLGGRRNVEAPPSGAAAANCGAGTERGEKWFFPPFAAQKILQGDMSIVMDERLGNVYNSEEAQRVALVAIWCIQDNEETRPTMGMVVKMLEGVVDVAIPPPPKLLQALISGDSYHGVLPDSGYRAHSGINSDDGCDRSNVDLHSSPALHASYPVN